MKKVVRHNGELCLLDTEKDERVYDGHENSGPRQNRSKVISGMNPLDRDRWDAGTRAIYNRIMVGHGWDI